MKHRDIERELPRRYRGRLGYYRILHDTTLSVSVSGIRGKSALTHMAAETLAERGMSVYAKQTGTDPVSIKDGVKHPIERDPRRKAILNETYWEVKRYWPFDAMVLENQAITPYTMRVFNELFCRPDYVLVTNVRRDHIADIARTLPHMAKAFARSVPRGATLVTGEPDPHLRDLMERVCDHNDVRFIDAATDKDGVPGFEAVLTLDAMMRDWMGQGLTAIERERALANLLHHFRWRQSALPGISWFHGAEINDVDSTDIVLRHLRRQRRLPVTFVAYLRRDRADRTSSFVPFIAEQFENGVAARLILVGHGARTMERRLSKWRGRIHVLPDSPDSLNTAVDLLRTHCQGQAVMTIINAVPPWPRAMARILAGEETPPGSNSLDAIIVQALRRDRQQTRQTPLPRPAAGSTR